MVKVTVKRGKEGAGGWVQTSSLMPCSVVVWSVASVAVAIISWLLLDGWWRKAVPDVPAVLSGDVRAIRVWDWSTRSPSFATKCLEYGKPVVIKGTEVTEWSVYPCCYCCYC
jgi:hypothetical protein